MHWEGGLGDILFGVDIIRCMCPCVWTENGFLTTRSMGGGGGGGRQEWAVQLQFTPLPQSHSLPSNLWSRDNFQKETPDCATHMNELS